jgi:hypothetical protein
MQSAFALFWSVACLALPYFSTLSHKRHKYRKKKIVIEREICVLISPQLLSETFPILRSIELDIKMYTSLHIKFPLFLFDFNETWTFSTYFRKILNISNFMKIRPRGRRDTTKLIIAFRNFCEKRLKQNAVREGGKISRACCTHLIKYTLKLLFVVGKCRVGIALSEKQTGFRPGSLSTDYVSTDWLHGAE